MHRQKEGQSLSRLVSTCRQTSAPRGPFCPCPPASCLPTSPPSRSSARVCSVGGGTNGRQPAFAVTIDGGHQWGVVPMARGRVLRDVTCPTSLLCVGVAARTRLDMPSSGNELIRTTDGGTSWTPSPVPASGTLLSVSCPSDHVCVAIGYSGLHPGITPSGFVLTSNDGGQTWVTGTPVGFRVCSVALCYLVCDYQQLHGNRSEKRSESQAVSGDATPDVWCRHQDSTPATVSQRPRRAPLSAARTAGRHGSRAHSRATFPCHSSSASLAKVRPSAGLRVKSRFPRSSATCTTRGHQFWWGTTDGGATWSKETFTIPSDAPNHPGQEYLSIGDAELLAPMGVSRSRRRSTECAVHSYLQD